MPKNRVAGSTVLAITSFISPVVLQSAGIPYFFALRVVIGIAMVSKKLYVKIV